MKWADDSSTKKKLDAGVVTKKKHGLSGSSNDMVPENIPDNNDSRDVADHTLNHTLKIRFHHKGYFISDPEIAYKRGEVYEFGGEWDIDEINLIDLGNLVREIGVKGEYKLWYVKPGKEVRNGLKLLENDRDTIRFINEFKGEVSADFYVETPAVDGLDCRYDSDVEVVGEANGEGKDDASETDPEYQGDEEDDAEAGSQDGSLDGSLDGIELDDSEYEEDFQWTSVLPDHTLNPVPFIPTEVPGGSKAAVESSRNAAPTSLSDFEDENGDSEELESPVGSDCETGKKKKVNKFTFGENGEVKYERGQVFASAELVRSSVKEYALQSSKNVYIKKNERKRIVVKCMVGCPYHMRFSRAEPNTFFVLSSYNSAHKCHKTAKVRLCKTTLLAQKLVPILKHTPNMKLKGLKEECKTRWGVHLSSYQIYRAKNRALEMIHGAIDDQYTHLRSYAHELIRSNPNSTVKIKTTPGVGGSVFERMYVCFFACKKAFVTTCRPLIGLDGCFLKGRYGGQLLTAVGKDGNNQMIPIAFAVVEAETKDSWDWFVELLLSDLNGIQYKRWSFISDQQKGLVNVIASISEHVEHRLCVKHLYGNWRKKHSGEHLKEALWIAARANTMPEFKKAMDNLKKLSEPAWNDMNEIATGMWSRAGYSTQTCCDLQVNNMCEAFNSAIIEYREYPIISLVEGLKFYLTNRIVRLRDYMLRYEGDICPVIVKILEKCKKQADKWSPNWCGDREYSNFSVSDGTDTYVVDLKNKTCSCRKWDLTGIPCPHSITCMWWNNHNPDDYVAHWYRKSTFLETYENLILPSNGPKLWPEVNAEPILPPYVRRAPGRPKKLRRKANDEPRTSGNPKRNQETVRCKRCKVLGHNTRTCKGKSAADRIIPVGGNKTNTSVAQPGTVKGKEVAGSASKNAAPASKTGTSASKNAAPASKTGTSASNNPGPASKTAAPATKTIAPANTVATQTTTPTAPANNNSTTTVPAASNNVPVSTNQSASITTSAGNAVKGGKHIVGTEQLFVPRKIRTAGVKRKIEEVGQLGTQQSVNKT